MKQPTSRTEICAARLAAAMAKHGVHPDVDAAVNVLIREVLTGAFCQGAVWAGGNEIAALVHVQAVITARVLERSAAQS